MNAPASASSGSALRWRPDSDKFRLLAAILLAVFAVYAVVFIGVTAIRLTQRPGGDFFALWSTARFVLDHPAAQVYDREALHAAQVALGMNPGTGYPFPYPPTFLLILWPLGLLPFLPAYGVAIGGSLLLYLWATVGHRWRSAMTTGALLVPTTTITIVSGQAGFLTAALLVGGFRLAAERPIVAGMLFGVASYKPQMGVLVPVALIAARLWRTIGAACATVVVLALVATAVFGAAAWPAWVAGIAEYSGQFAAEKGAIAHLMPTVAASLARLGVGPAAAEMGQLAAAGIVAWAIWRRFRSGPTQLAASALFVGVFLATSHAFIYDMPVVGTAVLWTIAERNDAHEAFGTGEMAIMVVALVAPITLVAGASAFPLVPLALALLLALIVWRGERLRTAAARGALDEAATAR